MNKLLFSIGNPLKGDDAVGIELGREVEKKLKDWQVVYGYDVPEDMVFKIRDLKPDLILLVDACVGLEKAEFVELSSENDYLFATHNIPLSVLVRLLREFCEKVLFLALPIDAKNALEIKEGLSKEAQNMLLQGLEKIQILDKEI